MVTYTSRRDVRAEESIQNHLESVTGQVTTVETRTSSSEKTNVVANVIFRDSGKELRTVPVLISDHEGHIVVPKKHDWVKVEYIGKRGQAPVITQFAHNDEQLPPLARPGHWRHEFRREGTDSLYVEAEPADHSAGDAEVIRLGVKPDGLSDPTTEVAVDDSGDSTEVRIQTDGDIHLSADGDIVIDEGGTATPVAKQDHTHDYDWDDHGGSGTTSTPNEDGTETEIE